MKDSYGELSKGSVLWYPFRDHAELLFVIDKTKDDTPLVMNTTCTIETLHYDENLGQLSKQYDYIILLDVLVIRKEHKQYLKEVSGYLKHQGIFIVVLDNKYALRNWCGEPDRLIGVPFATLTGFQGKPTGNHYGRHKISQLLKENGFVYQKFYYPMPCWRLTQVVYTDKRTPGRDLQEKVIFNFEHPEYLVADERQFYDDIIADHAFPFLANSFIIECAREKAEFCQLNYAAVSLDRSRENALLTCIYDDHVEKSGIFKESSHAIRRLEKNMSALKAKGLPVLPVKYEERRGVMEFVKQPTGANYIRELFDQGETEKIYELFDKLWEDILRSCEVIGEEWNIWKSEYPQVSEWGPVADRVYVEMIFLNCFYCDNQLLYFDQEFTIDHIPALFVLYRAAHYTYKCIPGMAGLIPVEEIQKRYGFTQDMWVAFQTEEQKFLTGIKRRLEHKYFYDHVLLNRAETENHCIHIGPEEYDRKFGNVLEYISQKQVIMFGTGEYGDLFMKRYSDLITLYGIVDNDINKWGTIYGGIKVENPKCILKIPAERRRVIICVKSLRGRWSIIRQLKQWGVGEYCIFEPERDYRKETESL